MTLEGLPPGEHLFSLELAGYEPMEVSFKLDPDTLLEPPAIELLSWDRIVPGGQVHTLPAILEQTNPVPPVRNREEVRVVVRAIVNVDGTLSDLTVVSSDNNNFNNAALRALANWRFEPATRHDRPVRTQINIPLVFPAF
ncbi:MAG: energy transducer TonB [Verrucomicrobia bacterium]|nr:energy transducer TonB [Verrucomicrobiota bacterium]